MHQSLLLKTMQSQQSIILYKVMHDLSTSSPEEDERYAVETSYDVQFFGQL